MPSIFQPGQGEIGQPQDVGCTKGEAVLRLFRPDDEEETKKRTTPERKRRQPQTKAPRAASACPKAKPSAETAALRTQIRKALKQLQNGKAVMACQTLEKALK